MHISVAIPAFNEEKHIVSCVRSVKAAFAARGLDPEIVVCDNKSSDATAALASGEGARVVFEPLNQIGGARNAAAAACAGDWLIFLDADSQLSAQTLDEVLKAISEGGLVGGGALVRFTPEPPWWGRLLTWSWNLISRTFKVAAGSFIYCRADAFRYVGGFSRLLFAGEELDLSWKLRRWGSARGLGFRIITSAPHTSSARKFSMYGPRELALFVLSFLLRPLAVMRSPAELPIFYQRKKE